MEGWKDRGMLRIMFGHSTISAVSMTRVQLSDNPTITTLIDTVS